jgi:hypothetical protein
MSTVVNTAFLAGPSYPDADRTRTVLRWLARRLLRDELRHKPPITLAGPVPARPIIEPVPSPPVLHGGYGPDLSCDSKGNRESVPEPSDLFGPYRRERLLQMHARFVARMERAFRSGRERRASAAACVSEHHRRIPVTALALSDTQLEILRRFAVPIPQQLRQLYLQSVGQRLAGVELGDGVVHAACVAAQREALNAGRADVA